MFTFIFFQETKTEILELKQKLAEALNIAAAEAQKSGKLPLVPLPEATLEHPQNPDHGDYASSFPMRLAKATRANPMTIAQELILHMPNLSEVEMLAVAPPGFINFIIKSSWLTTQIDNVISAGENYGNITNIKKSRVQVEFVSINPTGPLHVGHGRGAVLGSTLANVLAAGGSTVEKEYYFNDAGGQMEAFYKSLYARYLQELGVDAQVPENGYHGSYMVDYAREIVAEHKDKFIALPEAEAIAALGKIGLARTISQIKEDLKLLGITFDNWFTERSLYDNGQYETVMALLRRNNFIAEKEGAVWFASTALGEDKDNVVVRSDGTPTYFATDIAYHYNKFVERNFDRVIDIWGADHQGHVNRLKAAVSAFGIDPARLDIIIHQLVTLRRGKETVRVSKRSGDIITMRELVEEVGSDAVRFFFLSRSANGQMDFDIELAKKESSENPVYYVQYAHARISSIIRLAAEKKIDYSKGDVSLLTSAPELTLIRKLLLLPELVELISRTLEPHHLPYYAQELATVFHSFYNHCRVISEDTALTEARLKLAAAAKMILSRTLKLMGMNAPETM